MAEYYKLEIAKWNVSTDDLTLEQEAAYHRVVGMIRLYERPLKHNLRVLAGMWRCNERKAKRLLEELVTAGKLSVEGGLIIDEKAVNDASNLRQSRIDKQSAGSLGGIESGKVRRKSLKTNETHEATASTREEKTKLEKRREEEKEKNACALDALCSVLSPDTAKAFIEHRKSKRAPLTANAASLIAKKLLGHPDPDAVANNSIMNGWTGVFPDSFRPPQVAKRSTLEDTFARLKAEIDAGGTLN